MKKCKIKITNLKLTTDNIEFEAELSAINTYFVGEIVAQAIEEISEYDVTVEEVDCYETC
ncbi:hypothetical protein [Globicatella sanguinis]